MDKKILNDLKPEIRGLGQDLKAVKATFDALRAASSLKSSGSADLLSLAEREFNGAVSAMRGRLDQIATVLDIEDDSISANGVGEIADHTGVSEGLTLSGEA